MSYQTDLLSVIGPTEFAILNCFKSQEAIRLSTLKLRFLENHLPDILSDMNKFGIKVDVANFALHTYNLMRSGHIRTVSHPPENTIKLRLTLIGEIAIFGEN